MMTIQIPAGVRRGTRVALLPLLPLLAAACATTGATYGSGVGDRMLEQPPFYAGASVPLTAAIAHVPISYQRGATQPATFDPSGGAGSQAAALLAEMNAYLDSLRGTAALAPIARGTPPDVRFSCAVDDMGECTIEEGRGALGRRGSGQYMHLAVGRPDAVWIEEVSRALSASEAGAMLVLTLETGSYWTRQRGWRGDKVVELGTDHVQPLPWVTSIETPVSVLQLTGALVGRDGRAIRIGAEGLLARRTPLLVSSIGAQALIRDEDVAQLRSRRRDDLQGEPLAWQVALAQLVAELTGGHRPQAILLSPTAPGPAGS